MPFQKGNRFGTANAGKKRPSQIANYIKTLHWVMKEGKCKRVPENQLRLFLSCGWTEGRPQWTNEARRAHSERLKGIDNPAKWKKGHSTWNRGEKMPKSAGVAMSAARLRRYGITEEQIIVARTENKSWCSHHLQFEPNDLFRINKNGRRASRCNQCHNKYTPWYKERFREQRGCCAVCGEPEPRLDALCLDHDHECPDPKHTRKHEPRIGCVCSRDLLCSVCNLNYGHVEPMLRHLNENTQFPKDSWETKAFAYNLKWRKGVSHVYMSQDREKERAYVSN